MDNQSLIDGLIKIILTLENDHHGCKEEGILIAKQLLGVKIESNHIREMINEVSQQEVEDYKKVLSSFIANNKQ